MMLSFVLFLVASVFPSIYAAGTILVECPPSKPCITIGFTTSLTGAQHVEGQLHGNGTIMWANKVNKQGLQTLVNPTQKSYIRLISYDDQSNATLCAQQYYQLVNVDNVDHFLGPYGTSLTQAAAAVANKTQRIMIAGAAAADDTYSTSYPYLFGVDTTGSEYMSPLLNTLYQRGARSVVILTSDADFAQSVTQGAKTAARSLNYSSLVVNQFSRSNASAATLLPIMNDLAKYDADVFIGSILLENGNAVLNNIIASRYRPRALILQSAGGSPAFITAQGTHANHILAPSQWEPTSIFTGTLYNNTDEYVADYQSIYGTLSSSTLPSYISAEATAAGVILGIALSNSTSYNVTDLSHFLHTLTQPIETFFGPVQFDNAGRNIAKEMVGTQVINGKIQLVVAPSGINTNNLVYPMQWLVPLPNSASLICTSHVIASLMMFLCLWMY